MARPKAKKERVVCISFHADGTLYVEPDPVRIKAGTRVRWVTIVRDAKKLHVVFSRRTGSPFKEAAFGVPARAQLLSAPVAADAPHKTYKYTVELEVGKHTFRLDPEVEVER